jgi:cytochrome b
VKDPQDMKRGDERLVWDLPVRIVHWLIVLAVAGSWATHYAGVEWFAWHRRLGYAVLVLAAFRVAWGFVGTRHARFGSFLRGPRAVLDYLRDRTADRPVGHNPLGALGVVALLGVLLLQASSGVFANDEIMNAGPFYGWIDPALSNRLTTLHRLSSDALLVLISLHVLAVAWHVFGRHRPLLRAMFTGRKPEADVPAEQAIAGSRTGLALAIVAVLAAALALALRAAPEAAIALY